MNEDHKVGEALLDTVPEVSQEALDSVDMEAPREWLLEVMVDDTVVAIGEYHKILSGMRAARQVGDHQRAELFAKQEAYLRTYVAYLQYKYPETKKLGKDVMARKARERVALREHP